MNRRQGVLAYVCAALLAAASLVATGRPADAAPSTVVAYPKLATDVDDPNYQVSVNGTPIYVHGLHWHYTDGETSDFPMNDNGWAYAHFAFSGTAHVVVTYKERVQSFDISPASYGIAAQASGNQISFDLTEPLKIELHNVNSVDSNVIGSNDQAGTHFGKNDDPDNLLIWADPLETDPASPHGRGVVSALASGADNTGHADASAAINAAIARVPAGGTLYLDPGSYLITHSVNLKSNMRFYLAPGSELVQAKQYYVNGEPQLTSANNMVNVINADHVTIDGRGRLNGQGQHNRWHDFGWWTMILMHNANDVAVNDIVSFNAAGGNVWQENGSNVRFTNFKEDTNSGAAESDLVNFWNCWHCGVDNSFGKTTDDSSNFGSGPTTSGAISGFDGAPDPANDARYPSGDYWFTNSVIINNGTGAGYAAGTSAGADINGARWENNVIISAPQVWRALAVFGGVYRNFQVNNLIVEQVVPDMNNFNPYITGSTSNPSLGVPITLKSKIPYWNYQAWQAAGGRVGGIDGVSFSNVRIGTPTDCAHIAPNELVSHSGYQGAGQTVRNVTFNDVTFAGQLLSGIAHPADNHSPYRYQGQCKANPDFPDPNALNAADPGAGWKTIDWADGGNVDRNGNLPSLLDQPKVAGQYPVNPAYDPAHVPDWTDWSTVHFSNTAVQLVNLAAHGTTVTFTRSSSHGGPVDIDTSLTVAYVAGGRTAQLTIPAGASSASVRVPPRGATPVLVELRPGDGYQMDHAFLAAVTPWGLT
ncbi:glycosyl hydrolase family 28-related protein [Micromonospora sp. SL1-18]|uniref:glycosyl hydrolase family 28-related protein n=1 Tax=Micromonospora sp. SL1-18 TaxID=3399128 RepID=UPI003A4E0F1D